MSFRDLHRPGHPFILANAWDIGTAKVLAGLGAEAIATSSAAHAFTLGRPDGTVSRDEALEHAAALVAAVDVPVSGDFENGYGHAPATCAETVALAADVGLAGISIEDTRLPEPEPYGFDEAVARIAAAAEAARALPDDFVLLARADGVMLGSYDLDEGIRRVQAYAAAGADAVYIPALAGFDDLKRVCDAVDVPVNGLAVGPLADATVADFAAAGCARISLGSALARRVQRTLVDTATAMFEHGDLRPLADGIPGATIDELL